MFHFSAITIVTLSLITALATPVNLETASASKTIKMCRVELTPLGRVTRFHFTWLYLVKTNAEGKVTKVSKVSGEKRPEMVREDKIIHCIETWKLKPAADYFIAFSVGTTSAENSISITEKGGETINLILDL
jgi:hypothetical protein